MCRLCNEVEAVMYLRYICIYMYMYDMYGNDMCCNFNQTVHVVRCMP